jgi:hypothetical protein
VEVRLEGAIIAIFYVFPTRALSQMGVDGSTKLFDGAVNKRTDEVSGLAYYTTATCGSYSYKVSGSFKEYGSVLILKGQSPIVNAQSCRVVGYKNDVLKFTLDRRPVLE